MSTVALKDTLREHTALVTITMNCTLSKSKESFNYKNRNLIENFQ